jgi:DNA polymerase-3 subunit delta'
MFVGGGHPDFWEIKPDPEGAQLLIKIDQIRELRRKVNFPPMAGAWRVVLVKPAEAMNPEAANAFLKTLEEPPEGNLFILTAMGERDLLPTIVSRCRRLNFSAMPHSLLVRELQRRQNLTPEQASLLAAMHAGSLGQALAADLPDLLARRDQVVQELELLNRGGIGEVLQWAAAKSQKNSGLDWFISLAGLWYRDLLALSHQAAASCLVNQDRLPELVSQQQRLAGPVVLARLEALSLLHRQLQRNLNMELTINNFALKWQQAGEARATP